MIILDIDECIEKLTRISLFLAQEISERFYYSRRIGDKLGTGLIQGLQGLYTRSIFIGIGGDNMVCSGLQSIFPMQDLLLWVDGVQNNTEN